MVLIRSHEKNETFTYMAFPSKFFSGFQLYSSRITVVLHSYGTILTLLRLEGGKKSGRVNPNADLLYGLNSNSVNMKFGQNTEEEKNIKVLGRSEKIKFEVEFFLGIWSKSEYCILPY